MYVVHDNLHGYRVHVKWCYNVQGEGVQAHTETSVIVLHEWYHVTHHAQFNEDV